VKKFSLWRSLVRSIRPSILRIFQEIESGAFGNYTVTSGSSFLFRPRRLITNEFFVTEMFKQQYEKNCLPHCKLNFWAHEGMEKIG
jgi:hypothetical protein